jgi:hypothetical protein
VDVRIYFAQTPDKAEAFTLNSALNKLKLFYLPTLHFHNPILPRSIVAPFHFWHKCLRTIHQLEFVLWF